MDPLFAHEIYSRSLTKLSFPVPSFIIVRKHEYEVYDFSDQGQISATVFSFKELHLIQGKKKIC